MSDSASPAVAQSNLTTVEGDGGQPMNMTGNILLCARNSTGGGAYDGQISQLAIFNTTLVSRQVAALYLGFRVSFGSLNLKSPFFPAMQTKFNSGHNGQAMQTTPAT